MKGDEINPGETGKMASSKKMLELESSHEWAGNEKDMPEIHERIGARKFSLVFSSMSFRKG